MNRFPPCTWSISDHRAFTYTSSRASSTSSMWWARQGSVWPDHLIGPHLDRQAVSGPMMGLGVCSGHRRAQGSWQPLGRVAKPAVPLPPPLRPAQVRPCPAHGMEPDGPRRGGQGKQRFPTSRARAQEGIPGKAPASFTLHQGWQPPKYPLLPPAPSRGQDFVLLCPHTHYTPHLGGRPTGAVLGEVEEQTQKMKMCPHKYLNPRVHSSCIHRGPKLKQPRHPSTGKDKQTVVCPGSGTATPTPPSNKNQHAHLCNRMHDAENPGAEEKKSEPKQPILSDSSSVKF